MQNRYRHDHDARILSELAIWAEWQANRQELGWPRESSEVRAFWAAQTASIAPGRDNSVRQGVGVPVCRETVSRRIPSVPRIENARRGPNVDRLLRYMDDYGHAHPAIILREIALNPRKSAAYLASQMELPVRTFYRLRRRGLDELGRLLSLTPRR